MMNQALTTPKSYPSCDHSEHDILESRSSSRKSYWRRCVVCRKMAVEPIQRRAFGRRSRERKRRTTVEIPVPEPVHRTPLLFKCRGYDLEYGLENQLILKVKDHVVAEFSEFDALLVYLKRRGLSYPFC